MEEKQALFTLRRKFMSLDLKETSSDREKMKANFTDLTTCVAGVAKWIPISARWGATGVQIYFRISHKISIYQYSLSQSWYNFLS